MKNIKHELNKIKKGEPSFLGIDGGNINSKIWFCGIEFGSDLQKMSNYYNSIVKDNVIFEGFDLGIPYRTSAGDFKSSNYDRSLSLMYYYLFKKEISKNEKEIKKVIDEIIEHELYNKKSEIFKLNLYPLAKKDTSWNNEITHKTGITKDEYYNTIFNNRKKFFKELVYKFNPKIIFCTATNGMEDEFVNAFLNENIKIDFSCEYIKTQSKKEFKISKYKSKLTTVIIIPFLGRCNLNSYNDVIYMADYLRCNYLKIK